jgi:uncharacterized protein (DUF2126 family)/transglutaminase-like putative cysteine protease
LSIHVALNHVTHYRYDRPVALGPQVVRLRPAPHSRTRILSYSLRVAPAGHFINWQQDPQANYLARLVFPEHTSELRVEVDLVAEMSVFNPFDFFLEPHADHYPFNYSAEEFGELAPYRVMLPASVAFARYLAEIPRAKQGTIDFLVAVNQRVQKDVSYLIRMQPGVQTPEETLTRAEGSCRDSSWLLVQLLRHLGLAARFVSGYLIQLKPDVKALDGPAGASEDFTDLHAWCEVYLPGAGWVGFDPTSGLLAGEGHIPLACSPDPSSAAPISGEIGECEVDFVHTMTIERIWEAPRVTKPYSEAQWLAIDALGVHIDADLLANDVRLTQGGEPTFVSVDDRDGAEWNIDAVGPRKRDLAAQLLKRLKAHYAPNGLLHYGQGKWYPGEQLPRWSLNAYWRADGEPLWSDPALFADEDHDYGVDEAIAHEFLAGVARRLGLDPRLVFPAYEDVLYYLWRERRLPSNVDPFDTRLDDPLERERLRKVFSQGLDAIVGYVLPVAHAHDAPRWQSGQWFLRDQRCYLIQGDSPLGYRLPLDSQPWASAVDFPWVHAPDPAERFPPLVPHKEMLQSLPGPGKSTQSADQVTRTAMCAEVRSGCLYVFMPPVSALEHYLELVAAVEATAEAMRLPIVLEGYEPPRDPRLVHLRVTPDPGVIEVNIQPAQNWGELSEQTLFLYEAAHQTRLCSEKFMLDGRHTGTGGGNHFVLGGATPMDSPFLRRPDVLASMIAYWHNHPSLSYLFSGLSIGPSSQAPRIDEARNDSVYEIEVAFKEMRRLRAEGRLGEEPWQVDRMLRNLLIDVTGNTHRAEFCIDKLFSPDSATGRLGLLELRAFEMPPHPQMSLAQQLLLRGLVARFWRHPYLPARLKRWGTELHDRFMLPYFVWDDFGAVIEEMNDLGYALQSEWFAPHFEFRFPRLGDFAADNIEVELRLALEPWHVLGEEGAPGGAVRYVDSSVERLQLKARGLIDERHVLTCNGRRVPMQPTGNVGEFIGGVRYRAWKSPSSLHPTIVIHTPLIFDLVDTWMNRSCGGCQYHVAHPGGRNYETLPVNVYEAEARRLARFFRLGHTPGKFEVGAEPRNPDYPFTLDLRHA